MDLEYGEQYEAYRAQVRAFLEAWPLAGDEARGQQALLGLVVGGELGGRDDAVAHDIRAHAGPEAGAS